MVRKGSYSACLDPWDMRSGEQATISSESLWEPLNAPSFFTSFCTPLHDESVVDDYHGTLVAHPYRSRSNHLCFGIMENKHSSMLERLSNRHNSRQAAKSENPNLTAPSFESTQSFLSQFSQSKLSIDSKLSLVQECPDPSLKPDLDTISSEISALDNLVTQNSYFLPPFELRSCLNTISHLKQSLDDATAIIIPKKKFSFRNKSTNKTTNNVVCQTEKVQNIISDKFPDLTAVSGFKGNRNDILVKKFSFDESENQNGEFSLSDLRDCQVALKGPLRALFMDKLVDCKIYVGAVMGSVLIEGAEGCVFVLASHQIRIHDAKNCDFYLRVRSRPIIERCIGVRFAPFCLNYEGIEADLKVSNLDVETENWMNVDDFLWLRAVQSPNWSILPQEDRIGRVDISEFGST